jgi:hypothetical protein
MMNNTEGRTAFQKDAVRTQIWTTCLNCLHWGDVTIIKYDIDQSHEKGRTVETGCSMAKYQVPPLEIVVHGCSAWEGDIPF